MLQYLLVEVLKIPSATGCSGPAQGTVDITRLLTPESKGINKGCFVIPPMACLGDTSKRICFTLVALLWTHSAKYKPMLNVPVKTFQEKLREHHTVFVSKTVTLAKADSSSIATNKCDQRNDSLRLPKTATSSVVKTVSAPTHLPRSSSLRDEETKAKSDTSKPALVGGFHDNKSW